LINSLPYDSYMDLQGILPHAKNTLQTPCWAHHNGSHITAHQPANIACLHDTWVALSAKGGNSGALWGQPRSQKALSKTPEDLDCTARCVQTMEWVVWEPGRWLRATSLALV